MPKRFFLIIALLFSISITSFGQSACDPLTDPNCNDPDNPIPLDSDIIYLLIAGAVFGLAKMTKLKGQKSGIEPKSP